MIVGAGQRTFTCSRCCTPLEICPPSRLPLLIVSIVFSTTIAEVFGLSGFGLVAAVPLMCAMFYGIAHGVRAMMASPQLRLKSSALRTNPSIEAKKEPMRVAGKLQQRRHPL